MTCRRDQRVYLSFIVDIHTASTGTRAISAFRHAFFHAHPQRSVRLSAGTITTRSIASQTAVRSRAYDSAIKCSTSAALARAIYPRA